MGQARQRGTFEERQTIAIKSYEERLIRNKQYIAEIERNLSPQERAKKKKNKMLLSAMLGLSLANF